MALKVDIGLKIETWPYPFHQSDDTLFCCDINKDFFVVAEISTHKKRYIWFGQKGAEIPS
jgi:hypothetical protein